jgi:CTP synthase
LEAVRQLRWEMGRNACHIHLTYVPYIAAAKELKTKPTQHSVKELQREGIQPDILVMRTEHELTTSVRRKVALFCNVTPDACFQSIDCPTVFEVPLKMDEQGLAECVLSKVGIEERPKADLSAWQNFIDMIQSATEEVRIGIVGKYVELEDSYKSINEALYQAAIYNGRRLKKVFISSEGLTDDNIAEQLEGLDGVVVCPGFGNRGIEGKFVALKYCREHNLPTFGICLGMQCMVIEFARNVLGLAGANSTEMETKTPYNVIDLMEEQKNITNYGGTMRLGGYACHLRPGSMAQRAYGKEDIVERHRHRFEFNSDYREAYEKAGMQCVGENPDSHLVEVVEIPANRWYLGTQYHPEYQSTVLHPHPLFLSFVKAAIEYSQEKQ